MHPFLACAIEPGALGSGDGADVDDHAAAGRGQVGTGRLGGEEHGAEIDVEHAVELGRVGDSEPGAIGDAGVVDQDVQAAQRVGRGVDGRFDGFKVGEVQRHDVRAAAEGLDLCGECVEPGLVPRSHGHVRPGLGQRERNGPPNATAGARHKGAAVVQAESVENRHGLAWDFGRLSVAATAGLAGYVSSDSASRRIWSAIGMEGCAPGVAAARAPAAWPQRSAIST